MPINDPVPAYVDRYSLWRVLAVEAVLLGVIFFPLIPNISDGLTITGVFFRWPFSVLLIASQIIFLIMFVDYGFVLWRAVRRFPAFAADEEGLTVFRFGARTVRWAEITEVAQPTFGNARIRIRAQRPLVVPLFLLENGDRTLQILTGPRPG